MRLKLDSETDARSTRTGTHGAGAMVAGLNTSELAELALLLVAVGALSGFLAGVFGIGGGAILVPVFYECFRIAGVPLDVRMPLCIGTSLAVIIPTSIRSWRAHHARGAVDMEILRAWWLPVLTGVILGSRFVISLLASFGRVAEKACGRRIVLRFDSAQSWFNRNIPYETARVHQACRRRCGKFAARGAGAATCQAGDRLFPLCDA